MRIAAASARKHERREIIDRDERAVHDRPEAKLHSSLDARIFIYAEVIEAKPMEFIFATARIVQQDDNGGRKPHQACVRLEFGHVLDFNISQQEKSRAGRKLTRLF